MVLIVFGPDNKRLAGPEWRPNFTDDLILDFLRRHPTGEVELFDDDEVPALPPEAMMLMTDQVVADPAYQPPPPPPDPLAELRDEVVKSREVAARNIAASPHDKRFLTQKAIGKQAIAWIKAHPGCTPEEAEDYVVALVLAELPNEPLIPKLYWEHKGTPQGLAMSYLHEATKRGYLPAGTPRTWASLVGLIVATPAEQIGAWLRSL
ncbi:MAG: hypothetical protein HY794_15740 [Desulfarculus sp.]|nr:hypothetical protein [Desulfarculus sp.]